MSAVQKREALSPPRKTYKMLCIRVYQRSIKILLLVATVLVFILFLNLLLTFSHQPLLKSLPGLAGDDTTPRTLKVLFWNDYNGDEKVNLTAGDELFQNCKVPQCTLLTSKKRYDESDAVVMWTFNKYDDKKFQLPDHRSPDHKWVFASKLTPHTVNLQFDHNKLDSVFNVTMTYRRDSDIPIPYGWYTPLTKAEITKMQEKPWPNFATSRTELVAWFVSHKGQQSEREKYAEELKKYVDVHVYGDLGDRALVEGPQSIRMLRKYKFYLALESELCQDYITEVVWRTMENDVVPIVLGGADYNAILPPHSYIDVQDFPTPEYLANYLMLLDSNDRLYNRYFEWKKSFKIRRESFQKPMCDLCEYLHKNIYEVSERFIKSWFDRDEACTTMAEYYSNIGWPDIEDDDDAEEENKEVKKSK